MLPLSTSAVASADTAIAATASAAAAITAASAARDDQDYDRNLFDFYSYYLFFLCRSALPTAAIRGGLLTPRSPRGCRTSILPLPLSDIRDEHQREIINTSGPASAAVLSLTYSRGRRWNYTGPLLSCTLLFVPLRPDLAPTRRQHVTTKLQMLLGPYLRYHPYPRHPLRHTLPSSSRRRRSSALCSSLAVLLPHNRPFRSRTAFKPDNTRLVSARLL
jgi:hypothetical protein